MSKSRFFKRNNTQYFDWKKNQARNECTRRSPQSISLAIHRATHAESQLQPGVITTLLLLNLVLANSANARKINTDVTRPEKISHEDTTKAICLENSKLPKGCEDFKLVRGDISQAKTFILGETHHTCDQARYTCLKALSENKKPNNSVILFESLPHNKYLACNDPLLGKWNWNSIGTSCKGWNKPDKGIDTVTFTQTKTSVLKGLLDGVQNNFLTNNVYSMFSEQQTKTATQILNRIKNRMENRLSTYKASHKKLYDIFKINNPKIPIDNFHSTEKEEMIEVNFLVDYLNQLINEIKKNQMPAQPILSYIHDDIDELVGMTEQVAKDINHHANHVIFTNQFLLKSIQEAAKDYEYIYLIAGKAHVATIEEEIFAAMSPTEYETQKKTVAEVLETQEKIVVDLYDALDELAEDNPSAVLTCSLLPR